MRQERKGDERKGDEREGVACNVIHEYARTWMSL